MSKFAFPYMQTFSDRILNFELSKKHSMLLFFGILFCFIIPQLHILYLNESGHDYFYVEQSVNGWSLESLDHFNLHTKFGLLHISQYFLGNIRILPFVSSVLLLVLTFELTRKLTNKRLSGIVSMAVLASCQLFYAYDMRATFPVFWVTFYLASLYVVTTKYWFLSPFFFLLSIDAKPLILLLTPFSMYFFQTTIPNQTYKRLAQISHLVIFAICTGIYFDGTNITFSKVGFYPQHIINAVSDWWVFLLVIDRWVALFTPLLMFNLFICGTHGYKNANSIFLLMLGMILSSVFLSLFTDMTNQPYRFIPLEVFFAIGIGIMISNNPSQKHVILHS